MKFPERWHTWPDEVPTENVPLRIEVLNERYNIHEKTDGCFLNSKFWFTPKGSDEGPTCELFSENDMPDKVYWRLWEEEEDGAIHWVRFDQEDKTTWPAFFTECVAIYLKGTIPVYVPHAFFGLRGWYSCEGEEKGEPINKKLIENPDGLGWAYLKVPSWWTPKKESRND